ncbi:MAG: nuclear transport factor 2 family protein, partial [Ilumatobacteraceae bacterium]|nr:nuclear transport factor 2 family protein [Ilumatobacteraceae bacterium]
MTTPEQVFGPLSPVEALTAIATIHQCLIDYCHGIDRCDAELVASVYHPDATDDHGSFVGLGTEFAIHATKKLREYAIATTHFCGSPSIRFESPTVAHVET